MKRMLYLVIFILVFRLQGHSQTGYQIELGANRLNSAFILRNGMENTISKGYGMNVTVSKPDKGQRINVHYSKYRTLDMDPVWKHVNAYKIELNYEALAHFDNIELLLYPILGLSYNYISGVYTGKNDPDALTRFYSANSVVTNRWPGITAGVGVERNIRHIVLFANYKMHIVKAEDSVRIMDIGLDAGLKYRFVLKKRSQENKMNKKPFFKRLKMPNNRYDLH